MASAEAAASRAAASAYSTIVAPLSFRQSSTTEAIVARHIPSVLSLDTDHTIGTKYATIAPHAIAME
jgi:hypothetical protein